MKVLAGCEFSARVCREFRALGHEAWSCDLLPTEGDSWHIQGDIREVIRWGIWDVLIFHAPCTRLCNSGVRWLHERNLWAEMEAAALFFRELWTADIPMICGENPIPHKYALKIIGDKYNQLIQPWQFGHGETKATCLWLKGLPPLEPTNIVEGRNHRIHRESPGPDRWKRRSRTYPGIARAMAEQWGSYTTEQRKR